MPRLFYEGVLFDRLTLCNPSAKLILKEKEIADHDLINLVTSCLVETGGIQQVSSNLSALGYSDFSDKAYAQLDESNKRRPLTLAICPQTIFLSFVSSFLRP